MTTMKSQAGVRLGSAPRPKTRRDHSALASHSAQRLHWSRRGRRVWGEFPAVTCPSWGLPSPPEDQETFTIPTHALLLNYVNTTGRRARQAPCDEVTNRGMKRQRKTGAVPASPVGSPLSASALPFPQVKLARRASLIYVICSRDLLKSATRTPPGRTFLRFFLAGSG